jgi:CheY-like chemotaxis protein
MDLLGSVICLPEGRPGRPLEFPNPTSGAHQRTVQKPRVLVVDDERLLADTTAAILLRAGFRTMSAYDGFSAMEIAATFKPDYLLTDIMMPAMNGVELAITLTNMYPAMRILLFSGQAGIADILEESRQMGFEFPLLAKPVHPLKLVESLKALRES